MTELCIQLDTSNWQDPHHLAHLAGHEDIKMRVRLPLSGRAIKRITKALERKVKNKTT